MDRPAVEGEAKMPVAVLHGDVEEGQGEQRHLPQERGVREILARLHREQPQPGDDREAKSDRRAARQEGRDHRQRHAANESSQSQVERQDAADQQSDARDVRGIDEQIDRARALQQDGARPGADPVDERHLARAQFVLMRSG
jgi:hypothetical protein